MDSPMKYWEGESLWNCFFDCFAKTNRLKEGIAYLDECLKKEKIGSFYVYRSQLKALDGQKESALEDSQKAMELEPKWAIYKLHIQLLLENEQWEKAHELATLAIQKFSEDEVLFYLAKLACEYHRPQEAMEYLQKIEKK